MYNYKDIRRVHLEVSTRCNAACPDCPRNLRGVDVFDTYPVLDMTLAQVQEIFSVEFIQQLDNLLINGNYGDFVTARDGLEIVRYFKSVNPDIKIQISTNASAKPKIWSELGRLGITVYFRIDGLQDTHKLYRQNTDFDFVLDNAKKFIAAGGYAIWNMIAFSHNLHQVETCRQLSKELGFGQFQLIDQGRNTMPVFTPDQRLSHVIGDYQGPVDFDELYEINQTYKVDPWGQVRNESSNREISCYAKAISEVYVAANGEVYPCCWLGFYPRHTDRHASNPQLKQIMTPNNALEVGLESAVSWFNSIEESWSLASVPAGKIFACNKNCGTKEL